MQPPADFEPRSEAPLIKARSLVFVRHRRRDLDEALRFYTDFGLELAEQFGHGRADRAEPHHDDVEVLGHHDARAKI